MAALTPVVIDNGSSSVKAGIAGDDAPKFAIPTVVARGNAQSGAGSHVGDDAISKIDLLNLEYPMKRGFVSNWDDMELIWGSIYQQLGTSPEQQPVILSQPPLNTNSNKEKIAEIMFEKFSVPSLFLAIDSVLSLYAFGRVTGLTVGSGEGLTTAVPIYEGYAVTEGIIREDIGGCDLTDYLITLLSLKGHNFNNQRDRIHVENVKKLCYVAQDFQAELAVPENLTPSERYELPDGAVIEMRHDRIKCPEGLFLPIVLGSDLRGIHEIAYTSTTKCDVDIRKDLFNNVVLCGGNTLFPGTGERLKKELTTMASPNMKINVIAPPERKYSVWIGGSILGSLGDFRDLLITKDQYAEAGPTIITSKC